VAIVISAGLKFGPVRDLFEKGLRNGLEAAGILVGAPRGSSAVLDGAELTVTVLHKALTACARGCHQLKLPDWFADNTSVQHHSGFLPFLQRMGLLVKEGTINDTGSAAAGSVVLLGQTETAYKIQGLFGDLKVRLQALVDTGRQIREQLLRPSVAQP
jgi:hypothetical protein